MLIHEIICGFEFILSKLNLKIMLQNSSFPVPVLWFKPELEQRAYELFTKINVKACNSRKSVAKTIDTLTTGGKTALISTFYQNACG